MCHQYDADILLYISRSLLQGKASHKFIDLSENPIMRIYYTSKPVLFFMCAGNEAFYAALYLLHFTEGPIGMFSITRNGNPL
jgi:CDP-diacylglycerol--inositol 3-phosphatidyltransferase